jgi:chemotaxis response regulator CheB
VAVILSGLDGDGSAALKSIKAAGGTTFAQSDATSKSMPREAVETGHIDYLLPRTKSPRHYWLWPMNLCGP